MSYTSVIQMVSGKNVDENLAAAKDLLYEAAANKSCLAVLPENFALFNTKQLIEEGLREKESTGRIRSFLKKTASDLNMWIVGGTVPSAQRPDSTVIHNRVRSACRIYNNAGEEVSRYDKIHLFDADVEDLQGAYRESDEFEHGDRAVLVDTPAGRMGLAVCYDLRFPELFFILRKEGAEVISIPSAFTKKTGDAHWEVLVRARAIETQSWVLAANQGGGHSSINETSGNSMIVDPWGRVVKKLKTGEGVITADVDLHEVNFVRQSMPLIMHQRHIEY